VRIARAWMPATLKERIQAAMKARSEAALKAGSLVAVLATMLLVAVPARAQTADDYPNRPIRVVVGFSPGGNSDTLARAIGAIVQKDLKQPIVVDNRPGAGTRIAAQIVAQSPPDGYTLLVQDITTHAINASLYSKLPYDSLNDFTSLGLVGGTALVLVVNPSLPVKSVQDLIALAKSKPGQLSYASGGTGSILHLGMEMLKSMSGIDIVHVPYKGGSDVVQSVMKGETAAGFVATPAAVPQVKAGKLRALAVTTPARIEALPEVPTLVEAGVPDFTLVLYTGVLGPANMPKPIVDRINRAVAAAVKSPEMKTFYAGIGSEPITDTPAEARDRLAAEIAKFRKVVQQANVHVD
jgi:tripartite-type tricarboxylate transporter receptor subunit TctC